MLKDVAMIKRSEFIQDIILQCRDVITAIIMDIWQAVYKNQSIPKTKWLEKFQLSLKKIKEYDEEEIYTYIQKYVKKRHTLESVYGAIMETAAVYHEGATPSVKKDKSLLVYFIREAALQTAREVWYKPYLFFNMSHKKDEVQTSIDEFDKIYIASIKHVIRQQVNDIVLSESMLVDKVGHLLDTNNDHTDDDEDPVILSHPSSPRSVVSMSDTRSQPNNNPYSPAQSVHSQRASFDHDVQSVRSFRSVDHAPSPPMHQCVPPPSPPHLASPYSSGRQSPVAYQPHPDHDLNIRSIDLDRNHNHNHYNQNQSEDVQQPPNRKSAEWTKEDLSDILENFIPRKTDSPPIQKYVPPTDSEITKSLTKSIEVDTAASNRVSRANSVNDGDDDSSSLVDIVESPKKENMEQSSNRKNNVKAPPANKIGKITSIDAYTRYYQPNKSGVSKKKMITNEKTTNRFFG